MSKGGAPEEIRDEIEEEGMKPRRAKRERPRLPTSIE